MRLRGRWQSLGAEVRIASYSSCPGRGASSKRQVPKGGSDPGEGSRTQGLGRPVKRGDRSGSRAEKPPTPRLRALSREQRRGRGRGRKGRERGGTGGFWPCTATAKGLGRPKRESQAPAQALAAACRGDGTLGTRLLGKTAVPPVQASTAVVPSAQRPLFFAESDSVSRPSLFPSFTFSLFSPSLMGFFLLFVCFSSSLPPSLLSPPPTSLSFFSVLFSSFLPLPPVPPPMACLPLLYSPPPFLFSS